MVPHQPVDRQDRPLVLRAAQHSDARPADQRDQGLGCKPRQLDLPLPRPTRAAHLRQGRPLDPLRAPADGHRGQPVAPRPTWTVGPERLARQRSLGRTRTPPRTPGATAAARPLSSLGTEVATPPLGRRVDLGVSRRHLVDSIGHPVAGHHAHSSGHEFVGEDRYRHHLGADQLADTPTVGCRAPGRTLSQQRCRAPRRHGHRAHGHHSSRSPSSRPRGTPTRSSRRVRRWSQLRTTPA